MANKHLDCTTISNRQLQEASDCMDSALNSTLESYINIMRVAQVNLNVAVTNDVKRLGPLKSALRQSRKAVRQASRQANRSIRTCLRQNPANVCFRQKAMQSFWIALPKVMEQVAKIFDSGFTAQTQQKALTYLDKKGISGQQATDIINGFRPGSGPSTNTGFSGNTGSTGSNSNRIYADQLPQNKQKNRPFLSLNSQYAIPVTLGIGALILLARS